MEESTLKPPTISPEGEGWFPHLWFLTASGGAFSMDNGQWIARPLVACYRRDARIDRLPSSFSPPMQGNQRSLAEGKSNWTRGGVGN